MGDIAFVSTGIECPYCYSDNTIYFDEIYEEGDYEERADGTAHLEHECKRCGKMFKFTGYAVAEIDAFHAKKMEDDND